MTTFPASFDLSTLDGSTNGFTITGSIAGAHAGSAVAGVGDVNGDGFFDYMVTEYSVDGGNGAASGNAYLLFGNDDLYSGNGDRTLDTVDGVNVVEFPGLDAEDQNGFSVSALGDINGDGFYDFAIGAATAEDGQGESAGATYVVFGNADFGTGDATFDLASLDGTNGFTVRGEDTLDYMGYAVSYIGDVNGDGVQDFAVSAPFRDGAGADEGEVLVIYGDAVGTFPAELDSNDLNGANGFVIEGLHAGGNLGGAISAAGDVNGDGVDDFIISAPSTTDGQTLEGEAYLIYGQTGGITSTGVSSFDLGTMDGTDGTTFVSNVEEAFFGLSLAYAGDVNGDGIDDLIAGVPGFTDLTDTEGYSGLSAVLFGDVNGFGATVSVGDENGPDGIFIAGAEDLDMSGASVAGVGDVNGDGIDDLVVTNYAMRSEFIAGFDRADDAAVGHIVFGSTTIGDIDLAALGAADGVEITGDGLIGSTTDNSRQYAVSATGDLNGDGLNDFIIGAPATDGNGTDAGAAYVIFGQGDHAPLPETDRFETNQNGGLTGEDLLANDVELDGETLTVTRVDRSVANVGTQVALASGALLTVNSDGTFDYDPNGAFDALAAGETEVDSFLYTVTDGTTEVAATAFIRVNGRNDDPVAEDDAFNVGSTATASANVLEVLGGAADSDIDGDTLTVSAVNGEAGDVGTQVTLASGALLTLNTDGTFDYDPNGQFPTGGADTFAYTASDGNGGTDTATVTVTITNTNTPPVAQDDAFAIGEDATLTGEDLLADNGNGADTDIDLDALTVTEVNGQAASVGSQITLGSGALLTVNADGTFDYDTNGAFDGTTGDTDDTFTYTLSDGNLTDTGTATITVTGENDDPVATDDAFTVAEDATVSGNLITGDNGNGADNDEETPGTIFVDRVERELANVGVEIALTSGALLTVNPDGTFDYDPNGQFAGLVDGETATDSFLYAIDDGTGARDNATVTITITGVTGPSPFDDVLTGTEGDDVIDALEGDDTINALGGNDTLIGGLGSDTLNGGNGTDTADYSAATGGVRVHAGKGTGLDNDAEGDVLNSIENLIGSAFDDELRGGNADNTLDGGEGRDLILGQAGNDVITGAAGADRIQGNAGNDEINGGTGADRLQGGVGNDLIRGGNGADDVTGDTGNDDLRGQGGNDQIWGGAGNDILRGNANRDEFIFGAGDQTDRIKDFEDDLDTVVFNDSLWAGSKTATDIVNEFGAQDGANVVFDFGGGDELTVENAILANLEDDIAIISGDIEAYMF